MLLLLLLLLSSHLAQSFVLFLFIHYRRCRYCYCHWLSLFDHFENKYKYHEIAKQTNERFLHYEINANDKTNNQFHMPSFVFLFHFRLQNLQPDNVDSSCLCMCKCADRNDFDVMFFFLFFNFSSCLCATNSSYWTMKKQPTLYDIQPDVNPYSPDIRFYCIVRFSATEFNVDFMNHFHQNLNMAEKGILFPKKDVIFYKIASLRYSDGSIVEFGQQRNWRKNGFSLKHCFKLAAVEFRSKLTWSRNIIENATTNLEQNALSLFQY